MPKFSRRRGCGKQAAAKKGYKKSIKTKNHEKYLDQIQDEFIALKSDPRKAIKLSILPIDPDLPGAGQHFCRACAKYFISNEVLETHNMTKVHKKRVKLVNEPQYSQREADAAAGMAPPK